jgi:hypothetical protein
MNDQTNEEPIVKLNKDLKKVAGTMASGEARFMVDSYYQSQGNRMREEARIRGLAKNEEPHAVLSWLADNNSRLEKQTATALKYYAESTPIGQWAAEVVGVGPIINAGLQAYIDITKAETAGAIWNLMGFNPDQRWLGTSGADALVKDIVNGAKWDADAHIPLLSKAARVKEDTLRRMATARGATLTKDSVRKALARRPWNANLKTLGYKLGESFVKVSGNPASLYGRLFRERKAKEIERNVSGQNAQKAQDSLRSDKMRGLGKDTDCRKWLEGWFKPTGIEATEDHVVADNEVEAAGWIYLEVGPGGGGIPMLPPAQIHARARRWVVKLFISHWHQAAYRLHFRKDPPKPFAIEHGGHAHFIEPEVPFPAI